MINIRNRRRLLLRISLGVFVTLLIAYLILIVPLRASNNRDWAVDQERTAVSSIDGDHVRIHNVRNFHYRSAQDFDVRWEARAYDLGRLQSVWYVVEPFSDWRGPAHTLLSFGFDDGQFIAISVEIRKEKGEAFSPLLGVLRQYELAYVIGDERDLIGLRANHRHDDVYLYPIRVTPEQLRALFVSMLERANRIAEHPEFYNTVNNTCLSNIVQHIDLIAPGRIPFSYKTLLPAYSDDLAYDLGLIDTGLARDQYRPPHRINELAARHAEDANFSSAIRSAIRSDPR